MNYKQFLEDAAQQVWQMWNACEVRWREPISQEAEALRWDRTTFQLGCDVWDQVEAVWGKYGSKA